jgi:hypothetical protein
VHHDCCKHAQHALFILLCRIHLQGNVWFSNTTNITLAAHFISVQRTGVLSAGSAAAPHPTPVNILLAGTRQTPQLALSNDLVLGSKVGPAPVLFEGVLFCCCVEIRRLFIHHFKVGQWQALCCSSAGSGSTTYTARDGLGFASLHT